MKKITCCLLVIVLLSAPTSTAKGISVKTQGKLVLVTILSGVAVLTKYLVGRDRRTVEALHAKRGKPDRVTKFECGFDRWRIEWYGDRKYVFWNDVLQKYELRNRMKPLKG